MVENLPARAGNISSVLVRKIPWNRKWQPTSVFLPGESHGQRSLMGYSPQGHKESDITEVRNSSHNGVMSKTAEEDCLQLSLVSFPSSLQRPEAGGEVFKEYLKLDSNLPKVCWGGLCFCVWVLPLPQTVAVGAFKVPRVMLWYLKQWLCPSLTFVPKTTHDCGLPYSFVLFLAVLALRCCAQSLCSCSERGLLFLQCRASHCWFSC